LRLFFTNLHLYYILLNLTTSDRAYHQWLIQWRLLQLINHITLPLVAYYGVTFLPCRRTCIFHLPGQTMEFSQGFIPGNFEAHGVPALVGIFHKDMPCGIEMENLTGNDRGNQTVWWLAYIITKRHFCSSRVTTGHGQTYSE
jgi:hypothetical protein